MAKRQWLVTASMFIEGDTIDEVEQLAYDIMVQNFDSPGDYEILEITELRH